MDLLTPILFLKASDRIFAFCSWPVTKISPGRARLVINFFVYEWAAMA